MLLIYFDNKFIHFVHELPFKNVLYYIKFTILINDYF